MRAFGSVLSHATESVLTCSTERFVGVWWRDIVREIPQVFGRSSVAVEKQMLSSTTPRISVVYLPNFPRHAYQPARSFSCARVV